MSKIVIIGNSGAARECYWLLREVLESAPGLAQDSSFAGFLDWKGYAGDLKELQHFYLGTADAHVIHSDELFIIGVGNPELRRDIFMTFKSRGASFMNLIHPWTSISQSAIIGEGNILQRGSTVLCNANIGNGNYLNGFSTISHDAEIGDFNFFAPYSIVLGSAKIGNGNHLGPYSVILEHARMGDGNLLAPGGALYKGCKDNCRMAGNPALKIGIVADK
ncbi:MAG: transferase [Desulfovibrionaceae bacterium]|nr:transferase [Desulfovibrionaceae bacterium]